MLCKDCGEKIQTWQEYCKRCGADLYKPNKRASSGRHSLVERFFSGTGNEREY